MTKVALLHYSAPPIVGGVESVLGHHARLMADILVMRLGQPRLTWGGGEATLVAQGWIRQQYLAALRAADQGQFSDLIAFARS